MDLLESLPLKKRRRIASFTFMLLAAFPGIGAEDKWKKKISSMKGKTESNLFTSKQNTSPLSNPNKKILSIHWVKVNKVRTNQPLPIDLFLHFSSPHRMHRIWIYRIMEMRQINDTCNTFIWLSERNEFITGNAYAFNKYSYPCNNIRQHWCIYMVFLHCFNVCWREIIVMHSTRRVNNSLFTFCLHLLLWSENIEGSTWMCMTAISNYTCLSASNLTLLFLNLFI